MSNLRNSQLLQQMESNPLRSSLAKALDIAEEFQGAIEFVSGNRDLSPEGRQKATQAHLRKAIRDQPAMATIPRALLLKASSPYSRRGALWDDYRKYFGKEESTTLVWWPTREP